MIDKQHKALRLADELDGLPESDFYEALGVEVAALLRTQHEALERKDALLRQALEMLGCTHEDDDPGHRCGMCDDYVDRNGTLRAAIREELQ